MGINGTNADFSCFRMLAVSFVSDLFLLLEESVERLFNLFSPMEFYAGGAMGDVAADRPAWWRWAYLGL